jgi:hypothetical protein
MTIFCDASIFLSRISEYLKPSDIPTDILACWISVAYILTAVKLYGFYTSVIKTLES